MVTMNADDKPVVRLDWDGEELVWVAVQNHWASELSVDQLAAEVVRLHNGQSPAAGHVSTSLGPHDRTLTADDFAPLAELYSAYNEARVAYLNSLPDAPQPVSVDSERGVHARWRGGALDLVWFDAGWAENQTAQGISETLTDVLRRRPAQDDAAVPKSLADAKADLEMFLR